MTPYAARLEEIQRGAIDPAMLHLPPLMDSPPARLLLLAIGLQESRFRHRFQITPNGNGRGPARGFWQFERAGVRGVVEHAASRYWLAHVCEACDVPFKTLAIWSAIETNDVLAAALARLLIFTDPKPLPAIGDVFGSWSLYARRLWRPGKPHPATWPGFYAEALAAVGLQPLEKDL